MVQGKIKFFNRAQGFAQFRPKLGRRLAQRSEDLFLVFRRYLFLSQGVTRLAIDGIKAN
jgi:hypothetical protein